MTQPRLDPRLGQMIGDISDSPWPQIAVGDRAILAALVHQFDQSQWLDTSTIVERQYAQLARVVTHHATHSPGFARRLTDAGLTVRQIVTPAGLATLPELTRVMVQDGGHLATAGTVPGHHGATTVTTTSGSTGEPVRITRTALNHLHWQALSIRFHLWAEPTGFGRFAAIRANVKDVEARQNWGPPVSTLFETGALLTIGIETDIDEQLRALAEFAPDTVLIYPSSLAALLDAMAAQGVALPSVRRWRTIGETVTADFRDRIALASTAPLIDCYSSAECGYVALQCPDNPENYHVMGETLIVEIIGDDGVAVAPGETGRVVITDLHNFAMPLIRYATGDHATAGGPCSCGRGLPTLTHFLGRTRNMVVKPDGTRHWPLTGRLFRDVAPVRQFQFRQHSVERIEVRLVVERPLTAVEEAALTAHVQDKLRHPFDIELVYFEGRLPTGKNGKFEEFMSLID